jgi:hypothetical protein
MTSATAPFPVLSPAVGRCEPANSNRTDFSSWPVHLEAASGPVLLIANLAPRKEAFDHHQQYAQEEE